LKWSALGNMSEEEGGFGLNVAEKFFGLLLIIIGALALYYTYLSASILAPFAAFFVFLSIIPLILGLILLTAKTE
jgi:hypothetical protein